MQNQNAHAVKQELQTELNALSIKVRSKKYRFVRICVAYIMLVAAAFMIAFRVGKAMINTEYNNFASLSDYEIKAINPSYELLQHKNAGVIYESATLGNTNSNLLSGGKYCDKGSQKAESTKNGLVLSVDGISKKLEAKSASYLNIINNALYYRNDSDYCVWKYELNTLSLKKMISGHVGQIAVAEGAAYYIDISAENALKAMYDDGDAYVLIQNNVDSFAVLGTEIFYLTKDNTLCKLDLVSKTTSVMQQNISKFILANRFIIENNGSLIEFSLAGTKARILRKGDSHLINADEKRVIFSEKGEIFILNTDEMSETPLCKAPQIVKGTYFANDGIVINGLDNIDSIDQRVIVHELITE
jgi:hypothetical protein